MFTDRMVRRWKEAASLIMVARDITAKRSNYTTLMLRRMDRSTFAPKMDAFPGGLLDKTDFSEKWLPLYSEFCRGGTSVVDFLRNTACCPIDKAPPAFITQRPEEWALPAEVTFKICALRETFEETGVLLVRSLDQAAEATADKPSFAQSHSLTSGMLEEWTTCVRADASHFLDLCTSLKCVPDIWSLHLWSSWLTPATSSRRYDTPFFVACLDEKPKVVINEGEHSSFSWVDPAEVQITQERLQFLGPPQYLELARLASHTQIDSLCKFAEERAKKHGAERWSPLRLGCSDAWISAMPGDSLYGNYLSGEVIDMTAEDLLKATSDRHILLGTYGEVAQRKYQFIVNIPERRGHRHPIVSQQYFSKL